MVGSFGLLQAALRDLKVEVGEHMDTWVVSRKPIAVYQPTLPETTKKSLGGEVGVISVRPTVLTDIALLAALHFLPQGAHPCWAGPAQWQERLRLRLAHEGGDRTPRRERLLGEREGYPIRPLILSS